MERELRIHRFQPQLAQRTFQVLQGDRTRLTGCSAMYAVAWRRNVSESRPLSPAEPTKLGFAIAAINAWNPLNVSFRNPHQTNV